MLEFLLFIVSVLLVLSSSYFLASIIRAKRFINSIIYFALIVTSQLIISVEILSLFKAVNSTALLGINFLVFIVSLSIWLLKGKPGFDFCNIRKGESQINDALKRDKWLAALFLAFVFASLVELLVAIMAPSNNGDSISYHLARVGFWIQNQTLAHYVTNSVRQIAFPVNSEIFLLWPMMFIRNDYLAGLSQYFAYWGNLMVLFGILSYLKFSMRRILWIMLILASLPAIILQAMSTENDLVLAFFLFSSLYLFLYGVKERDKKSFMFSAIAFAISLGIKSSVFFFIPAIGTVYLLIAIRVQRKNFYQSLIKFLVYLIPAFVILSSYNYILNYFDFGNPIAPESYIHEHSQSNLNYRFFTANLIRYIFSFVDLTGIEIGKYFFSFAVLFCKTILFSILGLHEKDGLIGPELIMVNTIPQEVCAMFGILGFMVFLPLVLRYSIKRSFYSNNKAFILGLTGLITIIFILTISALLGYKAWNLRYISTVVVLSSPILAYSYTRKATIWKISICVIAIFSFLRVSTCNYFRPFFPFYGKSIILNSRDELRYFSNNGPEFLPIIRHLKLKVPNKANIAILFWEDDWYYPLFEQAKWKITALRYEDFMSGKNLDNYDYLIISSNKQDRFSLTEIKLIKDPIDFSKVPDNFQLVVKTSKNNDQKSRDQGYRLYKRVS